MIKAKVKIIGWPPYGAEAFKPRFQIRGEYDVVFIKDGMAAILDDHNQVAYIGLDLLEFIELADHKIISLDQFMKENPEKTPEAKKKKFEDDQRKAAQEVKDAEAAQAKTSTDAANAEQARVNKVVADRAAAPAPSKEAAPNDSAPE